MSSLVLLSSKSIQFVVDSIKAEITLIEEQKRFFNSMAIPDTTSGPKNISKIIFDSEIEQFNLAINILQTMGDDLSQLKKITLPTYMAVVRSIENQLESIRKVYLKIGLIPQATKSQSVALRATYNMMNAFIDCRTEFTIAYNTVVLV